MTSATDSGALAQGLAELHADVFDPPWSAAAFADLLGQAGVVVEGEAGGFILIRVVADEAEILTLGVRPEARRRGLGGRLVQSASNRALEQGATRLFLEVAEDNAAARALYAGLGFAVAGRRRGYYPRAEGSAVDALLLVLDLT